MNDTELMALYRQGPDVLEASLTGLEPAWLDERPAYEGAWTIREHVVHVADSETNNFIRMKSILGQPGSLGFVIDEERWTRNLAGKREELGKYLRLFRLVREIVVELVADELGRNQDFFLRNYQGEVKQVTLRDAIAIYAKHVGFHVAYIDRIVESMRRR